MYATLTEKDEAWGKTTGLIEKPPTEMASVLLDNDNGYFANWAPQLKELFATACTEETNDNPGTFADIKPLYMLPVGHTWKTQTGVSLIGDAAHLMTPWAGEGVNLALRDSLDLSRVLSSIKSAPDISTWQMELQPKMVEFERVMLERAKEEAEGTLENMNMFALSENGGEAMAEFFKKAYAGMAAGTKGGETA